MADKHAQDKKNAKHKAAMEKQKANVDASIDAVLAGQLLALDELDYAHFLAIAQGAHYHAKGGTGLALAIAG